MSLFFKNVSIYGAGAIGGWVGAGLAQAGCAVSVVARGATLQALRTQGLRLRSQAADGTAVTQTHAVYASDDLGDIVRHGGTPDLVVIAVKAPGLKDVAATISAHDGSALSGGGPPFIGPNTVVLVAMNGVPWWFLQGAGDKLAGTLAGTRLQAVDPDGQIEAAFPAPHVVGCVVHCSCNVPEPGLIQHHFGNGLIIGEPSRQATPRVQALANLLVQAGFAASVSPHIQKDVWYKLWGNMSVNPISALTGATTDLIMDDPLVRNFVSAVMLEAKEIGARLGIAIDQQPEDRHQITRKLGAFKTSMLQDVEGGKPVELDALVSAVKELGGLTGVATPFTDTLLGLARLHARRLGLY